MMSRRILATGRLALALALSLALVGCREQPPATPSGPVIGGVPIYPGAQPLDEPPLVLRGILDSHGMALRDVGSGAFRTGDDADTVLDYYQQEMRRLGWTFIDQLEFGGDGRIQRFLRAGRRGIVTALPQEGETLLLIIDGEQ